MRDAENVRAGWWIMNACWHWAAFRKGLPPAATGEQRPAAVYAATDWLLQRSHERVELRIEIEAQPVHDRDDGERDR